MFAVRSAQTGVGVHVHRSERTDVLLRELAAVLAQPPEDPLAPDLVAVPTPGIERFISQGLARCLGTSPTDRDGICANVLFPSPTTIVNDVVARTTGQDPRTDPWLPQRAAWSLLAVVDRSADHRWCRPLARHLGLAPDVARTPGDRRDRRFAVAARLTRLFASYGAQRPSLILDWAAGRDLDGVGAALPDDLQWQPELWRRLRAEIASPSPAERLAATCQALVADPGAIDLPQRLSVFGPSRLPAHHLRVLEALGAGREVHLWLPDASPRAWESQHETRTPMRRSSEDAAGAVRHPLLRSFGRDARELRVQLDGGALASIRTTDCHHGADLTGATLLGRLQVQIRDDVDPWTTRTRSGPYVIPPGDSSIQVHACPGQPRQAEVVRDVILGLLQGDPTLQPRDILIMSPDLATFAPVLSAAIGEDPTGVGAAGDLRLRIADRTPEQDNELLATTAVVLQMLPGRMGLSEVLELAARPPVRSRFGFDDDTLARLTTLATQAGITWGLDRATRDGYLVPVPAGTWAWGLDRLLLGVAMSEDGLEHFGDVLPLDDVQGGDVRAVGQLAEFVTRLVQLRDITQPRHTARQWADILMTLVTDLMDARGEDAWQLPHALGVLSALAVNADRHADDLELSLAEVRVMLRGVLEGRPTRANFRSGGLTVCGLAPMRSVPYRVICLVGLDDVAFPRSPAADGDDVLARDPLVGERDPRSEDRQLLLDAVMAATDHLVVTYTGRDDRSNEPRPPCPPLAELLDAVDATAVTAAGTPARDQVLVTHPLQPFDARNFIAGALILGGPFSHDRRALAAARTVAGPRASRVPFIVGDLRPEPVRQLSLHQLAAFLASPPAAFLRHRLGLVPSHDDDPPPEALPIDPDGLARWAIGERALRQVMRGLPATSVAEAERLRGQLPPGALGGQVLQGIGTSVSALAHRAGGLRQGPGRPMSVRLQVADGVRLVGTVPGVHGDRIVRVTYARAKPTHQVRVWPELLAAAAHEEASGWAAYLVARGTDVTLRAPDPEAALRILGELAQLYCAGLTSPLPLMPATGMHYVQRRVRGQRPQTALLAARGTAWQPQVAPERDAPGVVTVWGPRAELEQLLTEPPRPDEQWFPDEPTRFGALARRLWEPILAAREEA